MKITTIKCPNCESALEVEDGLETMYCKYCGAAILIEGMDKRTLKAKVRIREMEHEERLQQSILDHKLKEKKEEAKKEGMQWILYIGGMLLLILPLFLLTCIPSSSETAHNARVSNLNDLEAEVIELIDSEKYDEALVRLNKMRLDDGWSREQTDSWNKKREEYIKTIEKRKREAEGGLDLWPFD